LNATTHKIPGGEAESSMAPSGSIDIRWLFESLPETIFGGSFTACPTAKKTFYTFP
jgi:hypothetical protein